MGEPPAGARRAGRLVARRHPAQPHARRAPALPRGRPRPAGGRAAGVRGGAGEAPGVFRRGQLAHPRGRAPAAVGRRARGREREAALLPRGRAAPLRGGRPRGCVRLARAARHRHEGRRLRDGRRRGVPAPRGWGRGPLGPPLARPVERHPRPPRVRGGVRRPRRRRGQGAVPARARLALAGRGPRLVAARAEDGARGAHRARGDGPAGHPPGGALCAAGRRRRRRRAARPRRGLASSAPAPARGRSPPPRVEPLAPGEGARRALPAPASRPSRRARARGPRRAHRRGAAGVGGADRARLGPAGAPRPARARPGAGHDAALHAHGAVPRPALRPPRPRRVPRRRALPPRRRARGRPRPRHPHRADRAVVAGAPRRAGPLPAGERHVVGGRAGGGGGGAPRRGARRPQRGHRPRHDHRLQQRGHRLAPLRLADAAPFRRGGEPDGRGAAVLRARQPDRRGRDRAHPVPVRARRPRRDHPGLGQPPHREGDAQGQSRGRGQDARAARPAPRRGLRPRGRAHVPLPRAPRPRSLPEAGVAARALPRLPARLLARGPRKGRRRRGGRRHDPERRGRAADEEREAAAPPPPSRARRPVGARARHDRRTGGLRRAWSPRTRLSSCARGARPATPSSPTPPRSRSP